MENRSFIKHEYGVARIMVRVNSVNYHRNGIGFGTSQPMVSALTMFRATGPRLSVLRKRL